MKKKVLWNRPLVVCGKSIFETLYNNKFQRNSCTLSQFASHYDSRVRDYGFYKIGCFDQCVKNICIIIDYLPTSHKSNYFEI